MVARGQRFAGKSFGEQKKNTNLVAAKSNGMKQKDGFNGEQVKVLPQMAIDIESADPLASSLYITDIGYYPKAANARNPYRNTC